jgi:hypothetical protein
MNHRPLQQQLGVLVVFQLECFSGFAVAELNLKFVFTGLVNYKNPIFGV